MYKCVHVYILVCIYTLCACGVRVLVLSPIQGGLSLDRELTYQCMSLASCFSISKDEPYKVQRLELESEAH